MTDNIIQTFNLTKVYNLRGQKKKITALNNVNISLREGEIFGFLGPNGAGKTTMIQILITLLQPTSGYAIIDGYNIIKNPNQVKNKIALMLESDMLYYRVTAYSNLKFFCKIYNVPNYKEKIINQAEEFGLTKWLNQYVSNYSSGMKMKLALLRTILLNRKILFLDEPTLGLDVKSVSFIIKKLKNLNKTIFLTSHDMRVVEKLCDSIAFINNGNILKIGPPNEIKKLMQTELVIDVDINKNKNQLKSELTQSNFINKVENTREGLQVYLRDRKNYKNLFHVLSKYDILKLTEKELSLEELFLKLV